MIPEARSVSRKRKHVTFADEVVVIRSTTRTKKKARISKDESVNASATAARKMHELSKNGDEDTASMSKIRKPREPSDETDEDTDFEDDHKYKLPPPTEWAKKKAEHMAGEYDKYMEHMKVAAMDAAKTLLELRGSPQASPSSSNSNSHGFLDTGMQPTNSPSSLARKQSAYDDGSTFDSLASDHPMRMLAQVAGLTLRENL